MAAKNRKVRLETASLGGRARAWTLSARRRRQIARKAAIARWNKWRRKNGRKNGLAA